MRPLAPVLAGVVAAVLLTGCGADESDDYCQTVQEHQPELSDIAASTRPGAIFGALDAYRDLQARAPRDLRDEWSQVVVRLEALESALDDAGVDPAAYDPKTTPQSLPAAQRAAIRGAARDLGDETTIRAMAGIEQQALDVCKAPLSQ